MELSVDGLQLYRLRFAQDEKLPAIYFKPNEAQLPRVVFVPFFDGGLMVTPCYWGSHWPLARGNPTGRTIDDRIAFTPTHNAVMSWAGTRPAPLSTSERVTLDTLGRSRLTTLRRWAWLIGLADESDAQLLDRARSFATPPSRQLSGARLEMEGYAQERRATRLAATEPEVTITFKPETPYVNPVFEFTRAPHGGAQVTLAGRRLGTGQYAWDGRTLWLDATIATLADLRVTFLEPSSASERSDRPAE